MTARLHEITVNTGKRAIRQKSPAFYVSIDIK